VTSLTCATIFRDTKMLINMAPSICRRILCRLSSGHRITLRIVYCIRVRSLVLLPQILLSSTVFCPFGEANLSLAFSLFSNIRIDGTKSAMVQSSSPSQRQHAGSPSSSVSTNSDDDERHEMSTNSSSSEFNIFVDDLLDQMVRVPRDEVIDDRSWAASLICCD
jgi:hypothetical protein